MKDLHALSGAYVLDALDDVERMEFEAYMATSPATAAEVESLREVGAMLGSAAAETPPAGLKQVVFDQIDRTRQLPPIVLPASDDGPSNVIAMRPRLDWATRVIGAVAAVAVLVAVGLAGTAIRLSDRLDDVEDTSAQVALLAAAPDAVRYETAYPDGGTVTAVISQGHGAFAVADGLPSLGEDDVYALWALTDQGPVAIGALHNGRALAISHGGIGGLGLTIEPDGPLHQPTTDVVATLGA